MRLEFYLHVGSHPQTGTSSIYSYDLLDDAGNRIDHKESQGFDRCVESLLETLDEYTEKPIEAEIANEALKTIFTGDLLKKIVDLHNKANYNELERAIAEIEKDSDSEVF